MKEVESGSSYSSKVLGLKSMLPSRVQLLLYVLISILLLILLNLGNFWHYYQNRFVGQNTDSIVIGSNFWNFLAQYRVAEIIVWGTLGILIYLTIWLTSNILVNIRNDFRASKYKGNTKKSVFWEEIVSRKLFLTGTIAALAVFTYVSFILIKIFSDQTYSAIFSAKNAGHSALVITGVLIIVSLLLHLLVVLVSITTHAWGAVYRGL